MNKIYVKIHVNVKVYSNMASDWRAAVLPISQMLSLKSLLTNMDLNIEIPYYSGPMDHEINQWSSKYELPPTS